MCGGYIDDWEHPVVCAVVARRQPSSTAVAVAKAQFTVLTHPVAEPDNGTETMP